MKTKTIAIGLFPERLDVILCAGAQPVAAHRIHLSIEQDPVKWGRQVRDAAKAVSAAVKEMGAVGLGARVMYRGPSACAEFASPLAKTASEAANAAVLSCADSLSCPMDLASCRALLVAFEKQGSEPKGHAVVAADSDEALAAIAEMVTESGLKFMSATPIDAITMASSAAMALGCEKQPAAILHFGEHRSFLVIVVEGRIVFSRPIAVGLDALVASLKRPLRLPGGQTVELNEETARAIVHECGFPSRTQIVHEQLQVTGGNIVPVLQPVLQRFMVELRQSLRFALPETQRGGVTLTITGPGARTPGFIQIVSDELGVRVATDERSRAYDYRDPMSGSSELILALSARRPLTELVLEPVAISRKRRMRHMQRWLWTGAAASLAMIGFDAVRLQSRLSETRKQVEALQSQNEGMATLKATADKLLAAGAAMASLENTIKAETGARVCMGAVMQELSRVTPPSIRLYSVTFKPGTGAIVGGLSGYATADSADPEVGSRLLESYMQQLQQSPLLHRLALANVQTTTLNETSAQSFDVSFEALAAPVDQLIAGPIAPAIAAVETDKE